MNLMFVVDAWGSGRRDTVIRFWAVVDNIIVVYIWGPGWFLWQLLVGWSESIVYSSVKRSVGQLPKYVLPVGIVWKVTFFPNYTFIQFQKVSCFYSHINYWVTIMMNIMMLIIVIILIIIVIMNTTFMWKLWLWGSIAFQFLLWVSIYIIFFTYTWPTPIDKHFLV